VVKVLPDGTYLSVLIDPTVRSARRRTAIITAAKAGEDLTDEPAHLVRVVEYDVPDRAGNGTGELIVVLSTILDPPRPGPTNWPPPTISGGRKKPPTTSSRPICGILAVFCAPGCLSWFTKRSGRGSWSNCD